MNSKKLTDRMLTIFGTVMVFFYLGLAVFIIVTPLLTIDKTLRIIFAIPLFIYGIYRALTSISKIRESFSEDNEEE